MKNKNNKISAIAIVTLLSILVSTILLYPAAALADKRLPGMDSLIQEMTAGAETFHILEIVEDKVDYIRKDYDEAVEGPYHSAEIGFYFDKNEPFSVDEEGYAVDFVTTLSKITKQEDRLAYVNGLLAALNGKYGTAVDSKLPLIYTEYKDTFFPNKTEEWKKVKFESKQSVNLSGEYVAVDNSTSEQTVYGDYTYNEDYVVAIDYENQKFNGNYVENLLGFSNTSSEPAYNVSFELLKEGVEAKYPNLGIYTQQFDVVGRVNSDEEFTEYQKNGYYWIQDAETQTYREINLADYTYAEEASTEEDQLLIVKGTILYNDNYKYAGTELPETTEGVEYYGVESYTYAYNGYEYYGEYGAILNPDGERFIECEPGTGTHKKTDKAFSYTPGIGNYNFVFDPSGAKPIVSVEVDGFYYQGGFKNNNWFRKKVFLSEEGDTSLNVLPVTVRTLTFEQFYKKCLYDVSILDDVDLLVINGSASMFDLAETAQNVLNNIATGIIDEIAGNKMPCIINSDLIDSGSSESIIWQSIKQNYYDTVTHSVSGAVKSPVYWYTGELFDVDLTTEFSQTDIDTGFVDVKNYIAEENEYLKLREETLLSTKVTKAVVIQYILSCKYARNIAPKNQLTVLEIEPCADYVLTPQKVKALTGYQDLLQDNIEIVQMTTAEFVGKIHDLNGVYDFIYIGMQTGRMNTDPDSGKTVYNDKDMNGLVYTHTGDAVIAAERLTGLLDTDYVAGNRSNYPYSRDVYKIRTALTDSKELVLSPQTINFVNNAVSPEQAVQVTLGNQGVYRYSGNDITKENVEQLLDYVNAGYPLILDEGFAIAGTTNELQSKKVNKINTEKLDNSSYLYEFLNAVVDTDENGNITKVFEMENVFLDKGAISTLPKFSFFMNLPKLDLTFYKETNNSSSSSLYEKDEDFENHYADDEERFVKKIDGQYYLTYVFSIEDKASASTLDTKYTVSLFVDINTDGKYSRQHEKMQDIKVVTENNVEVAANQLVAGQKYIVTRRIPEAFRSIVPWKLEVSLTETVQSGSTNETLTRPSLIRESKIGYSKLFTNNETDIYVLQILSDKKNNRESNTWNLEADYASNNYFTKDIDSLTEYNLSFDAMYIKEYQNLVENQSSKTHEQITKEYFAKLDQYDMLIIGFSDVYEGFTNVYALEAIFNFIDTGKSVLFTHDTTSFVNYAGNTADNIAGGNNSIFEFMSGKTDAIGGSRWGYLFNQMIRDDLGMDRYGITNADSFVNGSDSHVKKDSNGNIIKKSSLTAEEAKKELEIILKKGQILNLDTSVKKYNANTICEDTVKVSQLIAWANKDVAYVAETNRKQAYPETQGYTYTALNNCEELMDDNVKTNGADGIVGTHTEYLNLDDDYGVRNLGKTWADTFKEFFGISSESGNSWWENLLNAIANVLGQLFDVLFGSIHNGSFDNTEITCVNQGQITEYPFDIDDKFNTASTHAQYYQLDLQADNDNDGESDICVWYCMSNGYNGTLNGANQTTPNPYSASPNDVRNNYYIYSIGNVFYTGAGHKEVNRQEKQLFINTIVAAYNASVNEPSVTILESESILAPEKSSMNLPVEYTVAGTVDASRYVGNTNIEFYYSVYDDNFVYAADAPKKLTVEYFVEDSTGTEVINGVNVKKLEGVAGPVAVASGQAYKAVWTPVGDDIYGNELFKYLSNNESFDIYVRVKSEFKYKDKDTVLYGYDKLTIKKTNLFELD